MACVDVAADLNTEDETGLVWTFLDEALDPSIIRPGAIVAAGSELTLAVCEVVTSSTSRPAPSFTCECFRGRSSSTAASSSAPAGDSVTGQVSRAMYRSTSLSR